MQKQGFKKFTTSSVTRKANARDSWIPPIHQQCGAIRKSQVKVESLLMDLCEKPGKDGSQMSHLTFEKAAITQEDDRHVMQKGRQWRLVMRALRPSDDVQGMW
jgi:hypothetical protein